MLWANGRLRYYVEIRLADEKSMRISAEAIYQYIYVLPRGELKATLVAGLRQEHKHRRTRKAREGKDAETRGEIADCCLIFSLTVNILRST